MFFRDLFNASKPSSSSDSAGGLLGTLFNVAKAANVVKTAAPVIKKTVDVLGDTFNTIKTKAANANKTNNSKKPSSSGGSSRPSSFKPSSNDSELRNTISELRQEIQELKHPKVYTNKELAEHYGLADQYNIDYWENLYNQATNRYYDDAIAEQQMIRDTANVDQYLYSDDLLDSYLDAAVNSVGSSLNRGIRNTVANQAQSLMSKTNSDIDYNMLQSINQLDEDRKAQLANNRNLAQEAYIDLGNYLMQAGVNHNKSDVTDYYNTLLNKANNYDTALKTQAALSNAAATKYTGLTNAAATNASSAANSYNNNIYKQLYDVYNTAYGKIGKTDTAYLSLLGNRNG